MNEKNWMNDKKDIITVIVNVTSSATNSETIHWWVMSDDAVTWNNQRFPRSLFIHFMKFANAELNEIEMKAARPAIHFLSQSNQLRALAALSWWKEMNGLFYLLVLLPLHYVNLIYSFTPLHSVPSINWNYTSFASIN